MLILGMLQWWYTTGWKQFLLKFSNKLQDMADFFSIRLLVQNMFAPFKQISVNVSSSPSLSAQISRFFDRLVSRLIGAITRLILLIVGLIVLLVQTIAGLIILLLWPLAPFLIGACIILAVIQVKF